jgi:tRNA pseudouridine38-40 synthase
MARSDWHRPSPEKFAVSEGMRRLAMEVAYNGSGFSGWQIQSGQRTVQQTLGDAVSSFLGFPVVVFGSGRTDSKVHAMGQVCHFDVPDSCVIPPAAFEHALILPPDITVRRCYDAPPLFHSRFSAMAREYRYLVRSCKDFTCFENGLSAKVKNLPPLDLMQSYACLIKGTHDFSSFCASGDLSESHFRDIYESEFLMEDSVYGGKVLVYRITGNAFLYHMVRSLVGTMLTLAQTMAPKEKFSQILESKDRSQALDTAKPEGLYLWRISFDEDEFKWFEEECQ